MHHAMHHAMHQAMHMVAHLGHHSGPPELGLVHAVVRLDTLAHAKGAGLRLL